MNKEEKRAVDKSKFKIRHADWLEATKRVARRRGQLGIRFATNSQFRNDFYGTRYKVVDSAFRRQFPNLGISSVNCQGGAWEVTGSNGIGYGSTRSRAIKDLSRKNSKFTTNNKQP